MGSGKICKSCWDVKLSCRGGAVRTVEAVEDKLQDRGDYRDEAHGQAQRDELNWRQLFMLTIGTELTWSPWVFGNSLAVGWSLNIHTACSDCRDHSVRHPPFCESRQGYCTLSQSGEFCKFLGLFSSYGFGTPVYSCGPNLLKSVYRIAPSPF